MFGSDSPSTWSTQSKRDGPSSMVGQSKHWQTGSAYLSLNSELPLRMESKHKTDIVLNFVPFHKFEQI